jgi:hypothetical protein
MEKHPSTVPVKWMWWGLFIGVIFAAPMSVDRFQDDAYIHARLAENLLIHGVPYFHPETAYKTGSSTGFVLLIAALSTLLNPLTAIICLQIFTVITTITALYILAGLSPSHWLRNALVAACLIPFFLMAAYGGMETPIFCLFITLAAIGWRHGKPSWVVFFIALATWFRVEAVALLALVIFYYACINPMPKSVFYYSFPFLLLILTDMALYGTIVPAAVNVKSTGYNLPLLYSLANVLSLGIFSGAVFMVAIAFHAARVFHYKLKIDFADVFLIFSAALIIAWAMGRSLIFEWYYCLLIFPLGISILLSEGPSSEKVKKTLMDTLMLLLVWTSLLAASEIAIGSRAYLRSGRYVEIGDALYAFCSSCTLVTSEIGGLGYAFKGNIYDAFGLGDPQAVKFHPLRVPDQRRNYEIGAIPPKYVEYRDPDFVVSMPSFSQAFRESEIKKRYTVYDCLFDERAGTIFGDDRIQVFSKKDIPPPILKLMRCRRADPE